MSVDTDILSTTDLRTWVEEMHSLEDDIPCSIKIGNRDQELLPVCTNKALFLLTTTCGCQFYSCLLHKDVLMGGARMWLDEVEREKYKSYHWFCQVHKERVTVDRVDRI